MADIQPRRIPLSAVQRGVWLAHQVDDSGARYNCAEYLLVEGPVDPEVFAAAWAALCAEADVLRIHALPQAEGRLYQVVDGGPGIRPAMLDFTGADVPWEAALEWMQQDARRPVDLEKGPVSAAALLTVAADRTAVYYRLHHCVIDGYGIHLLGVRLAELYSALLAGEPDGGTPFCPLVDLIEEDVRYCTSGEVETDRAYWNAKLGDAPEQMRLAMDRPGAVTPAVGPRNRLRRVVPFTAEDVERLTKAAIATNGTWQVALTAAVAGYLHRAADRQDVLLGLPVTGRRSTAARCTPAMTTNTVALRLKVTQSTTLSDLVPEVVAELQSALRHERYPLDDLRRDIGWQDGEGAFLGPMLNFMPFDRSLTFGPYPASTHNLASGPVLDVTVSVRGRVDRGPMSWVFEANPEYHDERGLGDHQRRLGAFVTGVLAEPDRPFGSFDLLSDIERHDLVVRRNATVRPLPEATVTGELERQVAAAPERVAITGAQGSLTYAELDAAAGALAARLARRGVGCEDFVALAMPRSPELVVAMLGVLKAGAAYVPVDLSYPADRVRYMLDDLAPACVVSTPEGADQLPPGTVPLLVGGNPDADPSPETDAEHGSRAVAGPDNAAYVIYTSGSTGAPKGVTVLHRGMLNFVLDHGERLRVDAGSRVFQLVSPSFDVAAGDIWPTLLAGGTLVLAPPGQGMTGDELARYLREYKITHAAIPAVLLPQTPDANLPDLKVLLTGGEVPDTEAVRRWAAGRRMVNAYGVTEVSVASTVSPPLTGDCAPSIGAPIANTQVYVLDSACTPVRPGAVGELHLAGAGVARGYLRRPSLTAERFVPCPYGPPGSRMYRTGDLVRWRDDDTLAFLGRVDNQVKVRGFRIETSEIDSTLRRHPAVRTAATVVRTDDGSRKRLVSYVQPVAGAQLGPAELRAFAGRSLPDHMVPSAVVLLERLPVTANGKLDHARLPTPGYPPSVSRRASTAREAKLCELFTEVLGTQVGVDDSVFDRGADSIIVLELVGKARAVDIEFTARDVFEHPTPAGLAALDQPPAVGPPPTAPTAGTVRPVLPLDQLAAVRSRHPGAVGDVLPVTPLQAGFLFLGALSEEGGDGADPYVAQLRFDLAGPLDLEALRTACMALLERHPNLRAAFHYHQLDRPVQVVVANPELPWAVHDLTSRPEATREAEAERLAECERGHRFDLSKPPLLRVAVLRLADSRHRVLLTAHHILWDGWSTTILAPELFALYQDGAAADLPPVVPYSDYLEWLDVQDRDAATAAWSAALNGLVAPTLVAPGAGAGAEQTRARCLLSAELTDAVARYARGAGLTVSTVLYGAWALLLYQLTGRDDVVFGASVSGRPPELPGAHRMVGLLTNTVPVRVTLRPGETVRDTLQRVQHEQAVLMAHHHLGLTDIQRLTGVSGELFDTAVSIVSRSFDVTGWSASLRDVRLVGHDVSDGTHHPLRMVVVVGDRLEVVLGHRPDLIRTRTAAGLLDRFVAHLESIVLADARQPGRSGSRDASGAQPRPRP